MSDAVVPFGHDVSPLISVLPPTRSPPSRPPRHSRADSSMWPPRLTTQSTQVTLRRLRSGGGRVRGSRGGPRGDKSAGWQTSDYLLYGTLVVMGLLVFCCMGRFWSSYLKEGGSVTSVLGATCMMLGFSCGLHSRGGFCVWLFRNCCEKRYRTFPEIPMQDDSLEQARDLPESESVPAAESSSGSHCGVQGKDLLTAQAQTAVTAFEPSPEGAKAEGAITECVICLESFSAGEPLRILPCMHRYHQSCIDKWLTVHLSCPICKSKLGRRSKRTSQSSLRA